MTQPVSFKDVMFVLHKYNDFLPEVKSEFDLLPKKMDVKVYPILHGLGIDINRPITVRAYKHRTLNDEVVIGYRYEGRMRLDKEWLTGKGCGVMERISATAYTDPSLTQELCELVGSDVNINQNSLKIHSRDFPESQLSDTYKEDSDLITTLNNIALQVRGEITV